MSNDTEVRHRLTQAAAQVARATGQLVRVQPEPGVAQTIERIIDRVVDDQVPDLLPLTASPLERAEWSLARRLAHLRDLLDPNAFDQGLEDLRESARELVRALQGREGGE